MIKNLNNRSEIYKVSLDSKERNDVRILANDFILDNSNVLDVGCACGDFGELVNRNKKCNIYGLEYDVESLNIATKTNAYQIVHHIDLNIFDESKFETYNNYFDSIVMLDVLEHILNPEEVIKKLKNFLKKDGFFIISLPNVAFCDIKVGLLKNNFTYSDTGILDKTHLKFYTHKSISNMMTDLNLEITNCLAKVSYYSNDKSKSIPNSVKKYINKDPHSFVYQYLIKAVPCKKNIDILNKINNAKMDIKFKQISKSLKKVVRNNKLRNLFPKGTKRYNYAVKIKNYIDRKRNK